MTEQKKGMRFWVRGLRYNQPPEYKWADEPYPKGGDPSRYSAPNILLNGKPLRFVGEIYIEDPSVCMDLIKSGDHLRFDPQEAVDKGIIGADAMAKLGFPGLAKKADAPEPKEPPPAERPLPDFSIMRKQDLLDYAVKNDIALDGRMNHDNMIATLKAELKKQKESK